MPKLNKKSDVGRLKSKISKLIAESYDGGEELPGYTGLFALDAIEDIFNETIDEYYSQWRKAFITK